MLEPLSIHTKPLERPSEINVAEFVTISRQRGAVYDDAILRQIGESINKWSRLFQDDAQSLGGQIWHETGFFTFGGDVRPYQYNFAGIAATGGVPGASFPNPDIGVLAVVVHRAVYMRGAKESWPEHLRTYADYDPRYQAVINAGYGGTVRELQDFNGKWAVPGTTYATQLVAKGNLISATERVGGINKVVRVAIAAGHRNASGGNQREAKWAAPLTKAYMDMGRRFAPAIDIRTYTPNDGLGVYTGDLCDGANTLYKWRDAGWTADYYAELHFQGLTEGSNAGRGFFVIWPDWDNDVDVDVRDRFRPTWAATYQQLTGMPAYGGAPPDYPAGMSERRTGVGATGSRLGVFRCSEELKAVSTRMIIEHGSHTSPADRAIILGGPNKNPDVAMPTQDWMDRSAYAFFKTICQLEGMQVPFEFGQPERQPDPIEPEPAYAIKVDEFYLEGSFAKEWEREGSKAYAIWGPPRSGMILAPIDGVMRPVQLFERNAMGRYDMGTPDGVQVSHAFHVRALKPSEREEAVLYAVTNGLVDPLLVR